MRTFATATAVAALLVAAPAMAQQTQPAPQQQQQQQQQAQGAQQQGAQQQGQQQVAQQDRQFATTAAAGNMLEVRLGEIAQDQAQDQQVKDFGQRMVEDHQSANDKLMQIAQTLNLDVPQTLPEEEQQTVGRFQQLQGQEFDREYIRYMVEDHNKAVEAYRTQINQGQNQELKQYAENTLPTLEEHLNQAQQIGQQMGLALAQAGQQQQGQQQQAQAGQQEQTEVTVDQAPADVAVEQPSPDVTVVDPEPQVRVDVPEPDVQVTQPEPEVEVQQAQPQVDVERQGQADVTIVERQTQQPDQAQQQQAQQGQAEDEGMVEETAEATGEAVEETAEAPVEAIGEAGEETGQALEGAGRQVEETGQQAEQMVTGEEQQQQFANLQDVVGEPVYGRTGEQVGEVSEILFDTQGNAERLVIDRGGFLGIGEETITIDMQNVNVTQEGIQVNMTDEQIADLPEYQPVQ